MVLNQTMSSLTMGEYHIPNISKVSNPSFKKTLANLQIHRKMSLQKPRSLSATACGILPIFINFQNLIRSSKTAFVIFVAL